MSRIFFSNFLSRISYNSLLLISVNLEFIRLLDLIRYSKKFQSIFDISLLTYQRYFLLKNIKINFSTISLKELLFLLKKEFNNFNKPGDDIVLAKLIKEINNGEQLIKVKKNDSYLIKEFNNNYFYYKYKSAFMTKIDDIPYNKRLVALYLDSAEYAESYLLSKNIFFKTNSFNKRNHGSFPYLKILKINNNFVIPFSMLMNLIKLSIYINDNNELIFVNDVDKYCDKGSIFHLSHLKYLKISRKDESNGNKNIIIKRNRIKYYNDNKIKLCFPHIETLIIDIDLNKDTYILNKFHDLNLINKGILFTYKSDVLSIYNYIKEKILNYEFKMMTVIFKLGFVYTYNTKKLIANCEMNRATNGLKNYYFRRSIYKEENQRFNISEIYKENTFNEKLLTLYFNRYGPVDCCNKPPLTNNANYIVLISKKDISLCNKMVNDIFDIKENNYSIQHIIISLEKKEKCFNNLIKNISKFKVLKNLIIKDYIKNKNNLMDLISKISQKRLLKTVKFNYKGNLGEKTLNFIKQKIPNIYVTKKANSDIFEFSYINNKD